MAEKTREDEIREFADNWYGASRETEESAFVRSRSNLWQASLIERRDPSQCGLIRNRSRNALRRGEDPATAPDELATHLRNQAAFYAEIAKRATDYPARNRQRLRKDTLVGAERNKERWDEETKRRRDVRHDAQINRDRILTVAAELMGRRGRNVPLADVAEAAGVGVGTLYRGYRDRTALLHALEHRAYGLLIAALDRIGESGRTGAPAVQAYLEECLRLGDQPVLPLRGAPPLTTPPPSTRGDASTMPWSGSWPTDAPKAPCAPMSTPPTSSPAAR